MSRERFCARRSTIGLSGFTLLLAVSANVAAQDGQQLYQAKGCAACHGPTGNEPIAPNYPRIAGQNPQYAVNQMQLIKSGERSGGQTAVMRPIIAGVTDVEMAAIAEWLSKQPCK